MKQRLTQLCSRKTYLSRHKLPAVVFKQNHVTVSIMLESELRLPVFKWLANNGVPFRYEVPLPWGRADVIGVDQTSFNNSFNLKLLAGLTNPIRARLLSFINRHGAIGCGFNSILEEFQYLMNGEEIVSHLYMLQNRGLIHRGETKGGESKFTSIGLRKRPRLISIELKLKRATEVVKQAMRNQVFSAITYVALPIPQAEYLVNFHAEKIKTSGLGVLGIHGNECQPLIIADRRIPMDLAIELQVLAQLRRTASQVRSASMLPPREMH